MNSFGRIFRCTTFGESHGEAIGCVIDGCPAGLELHISDIENELVRDIPDKLLGTPRKELNEVKILSGIFNNKTLGTPICILIPNGNHKSNDYKLMENCYRPGHAEYTYHERYGIYHPYGGGRASGRECIARLAAGAVAKKILSQKNIYFESKIDELAGERCVSHISEKLAQETCLRISEETGDSTGGIISLIIKGVPAGVGSPVFGKLNALIMYALSTIGGVKGVENGLGFDASRLTGSSYNDEFGIIDDEIQPLTNNAGGVLGGISTGQNLTFRIAVKPTPSIPIPQKSVNWQTKEEFSLELNGRFDKNFTPRVAPVAEAMASLVLIDEMIAAGMINPTRIGEVN
ncbi:MAG: chorismate synthase [Bacillota bacterium]|nr:chorismate synthase [Bacillota bacterium]